MDNIETSNPNLRNGPSCQRFRSVIQMSTNLSSRKLPAIAVVVAEVLTLQAYSPSNHYDYLVDLATAEIERSRFNPRKFAIKTGSRVFNIFCNNNIDANVWASIIAHSSSRCFSDFYILGQQIADGRHSKVYLAHAKNDPRSTEYVVKVNNRVTENNGCLSRSQYERDAHIELMADFDGRKSSPREKKIDLEERKQRELKLKLSLDKIVLLRDSFGTPTEDFLVFQYQDGEILSRSISKDGPLSERNARIVMWDLLNALHFMHEQGVVHRDVSASNVFFWNRCGKVRAKLFDLSEARQIPDYISAEEPFRDSPGRLPYKALEILFGRYHGKPSDIWACGVLLYRMLSGVFPFEGETEQELRENIKYKVLSRSLFAAPIWNTVSPEAMLLIKQMLQPDPFKRPSALGARSHKWFSNEFRLARIDVTGYEKKLRVPQRPQTPVGKKLWLQNRAVSTCDPKVLPAPFRALRDDEIEDDGEAQGSGRPCIGKGQCEAVSSDSEIPPSPEPKGKCNSNGSSERQSGPSSNVENSGGSNVSFVTSLAKTFRLDRLGNMALTFVGKLTQLQATLAEIEREFFPNLYGFESEVSSVTSSDSESEVDPEKPLPGKRRQTVRVMLPDRERICIPPQESSMSPLRRSSLAHHCNHLCSHRPCTRSVLKARAVKILRHSRSVAISPSVTTRGTIPDLALCVRQQQREGSSTEIVPITRFIDDDVFQWARKTKLFSDLNLKRAPVDPLFFYRGPSSMDREARENELLAKFSGAGKQSSPLVLLRDEMCVGTHIMKSVVALGHIGLPQFFKSRPSVARLILGSPTAQLQLSMILPYRRKFRIAGMALMVMFRIISLKKGTCLTRRIARGQPLLEELCTLLTKIRRRCHMHPLRARIPKKFPSDELPSASVCRKERVDPEPKIAVTPQFFWSRQFEVKKGTITKAWKSLKHTVISVRHALTTALTVGNSQEDADESDGDNEDVDRDECDDGETDNMGSDVGSTSTSSQEITSNELDDFDYALNIV